MAAEAFFLIAHWGKGLACLHSGRSAFLFGTLPLSCLSWWEGGISISID